MVGILALGIFFATPALAGRGLSGLEFRLTCMPAMYDVSDWYEGYLERDYSGYGKLETDSFVIPVGLSLAYRWDISTVLDGCFAYLDLGPAAILLCDDATFWTVPVGGGIGYCLGRDAAVSVYGKLGMRYPFAGGDSVDESSAGLLIAAGIEFAKSDNLLWFAEVALDSSSISFSDPYKEEEIDLGILVSFGLKFN